LISSSTPLFNSESDIIRDIAINPSAKQQEQQKQHIVIANVMAGSSQIFLHQKFLHQKRHVA
jgi:hypothetical protein